MRGPQDEQNLKDAAANTNEILLDVFGLNGWGFAKGSTAALCGPANCRGGKCDHNDARVSTDQRPTLELAFV